MIIAETKAVRLWILSSKQAHGQRTLNSKKTTKQSKSNAQCTERVRNVQRSFSTRVDASTWNARPAKRISVGFA